jgi:hypothetical protein
MYGWMFGDGNRMVFDLIIILLYELLFKFDRIQQFAAYSLNHR